jgi:drug/metabolite transporter (DMT)-like permease
MPGVLSGLTLGATFFFFILSVTQTTVANTLVLMSTGPFFAAAAGQLFLGERVPARTWFAIAVALAGVVLMFTDGLGTGQLAGNLLALGVPIAFALNVVVLRRYRASVDLIPSVLIAGVLAMLVAAPLAWPFTPTARDFAVLGAMGFFQVGAGCVLMTVATRYLSAGEIGLLALIEILLGPLWVWLGIGERPSNLALVGGCIVLGALVGDAAAGRRGRAAPAAKTALLSACAGSSPAPAGRTSRRETASSPARARAPDRGTAPGPTWRSGSRPPPPNSCRPRT